MQQSLHVHASVSDVTLFAFQNGVAGLLLESLNRMGGSLTEYIYRLTAIVVCVQSILLQSFVIYETIRRFASPQMST